MSCLVLCGEVPCDTKKGTDMLSTLKTDASTALSPHSSPEAIKAALTKSNFDNLPDSGYITQRKLIPDVVPFSSATLWRKCKAGHFPRPVKLSERVTAWRVGDIRQFLLNQAKAA